MKTYFSFHQSIARIMGKYLGRFFLLPHTSSIGNAIEDYFHALLKAKESNQKLTVITMNGFLKPTRLMIFDPAYLQFTDSIVRPAIGSWQQRLLSSLFSIYFLLTRLTVMVAYKLFKIKIRDSYFHPSLGQELIWIPSGVESFDWENVRNRNWANALENFDIHLKLSEKLEKDQQNLLKKFGIQEQDWFVCLHVREGGYSEDWSNVRNSNILDYLPSINAITARGGWVIRIGDSSMTKLPILDRVIDLANHPLKSPLLDAYLMANSSYIVGTMSGMYEYCHLFSKPALLTNSTFYIASLPMKPSDIVIFKHVYSVTKKRTLTIREWLMAYEEIDEKTWTSTDWIYLNNSSEEILAAVIELLDGEQPYDVKEEQAEFRRIHSDVVHQMSLDFRFISNDKLDAINTKEWYRFATQYISWKGNVGADFLRRYWRADD